MYYIYRVTNRKLPKLIVYNFEMTVGKNMIKIHINTVNMSFLFDI